jgi:hypothetical protein
MRLYRSHKSFNLRQLRAVAAASLLYIHKKREESHVPYFLPSFLPSYTGTGVRHELNGCLRERERERERERRERKREKEREKVRNRNLRTVLINLHGDSLD